MEYTLAPESDADMKPYLAKYDLQDLEPSPILTLVGRLIKRLSDKDDPTLTRKEFDNNINMGQIEHVAQMLTFAKNPDIQTIFIVSENPESTEKKHKEAFQEIATK